MDAFSEELKQNYFICWLCSQLLVQPKTLPCLHTFCYQCLHRYTQEKQEPGPHQGVYKLVCPRCNKKCQVPRLGVDGFLDNYLIESLITSVNSRNTTCCDLCKDNDTTVTAAHVCIKCEDFLCEECAKNHKGTRVTRLHHVVSLHTLKSLHQTLQHDEQAGHKTHAVHFKLLYRFGKHGEDFFSPFAIATGKADDIYVSCENNKICLYSVGGEHKKTIFQNPLYGLPGNCLPNMCCAVTVEGYVAVAMRKDIVHKRVHVASVESLAGREVGLCTVKPPHLTNCKPSGITVLPNHHIAVSDIGNHCIFVFNSNLKFYRSFGKYGKKETQFKSPYFIASTVENNILVSDYDNHRVKEFMFTGKYIRTIARQGKERGELLHPMGLCAGSRGNIFVCDRDNHRVQMFGSDGKFVRFLVKNTCRDGLDLRPQDIKLTDSGLLAVLIKGIEGLNFAEILIFKTNLSGEEFEQDHQQLFTVRDTMDRLQLNPLGRRQTGVLPPIGSIGSLEPSAPVLQPDVVPSHGEADNSRGRSRKNSPSTLCVIS